MTPVEEAETPKKTPWRFKVAGGIPYMTPAGVSSASLDKADEINNASGRRISAPVRKWFVRSLRGELPPLAALYSGNKRGGRSGYLSVKVLLSIIWKTSKPPFQTVMTAPAIAELLDLPDPSGNGARRVRDALKQLATANLIRLEHRPGNSPIIHLMNEMGNGKEYTLPSTSYTQTRLKKPNQDPFTDPNLYFQLPAELWTEGFMQILKGPGLVMLLILLAEQANKKPVWFSGEEFSSRYRISSSTRTKGSQELVNLEIMTRKSVALPPNWGASSFEKKRRRYEYSLSGVINRLSDDSNELGTTTSKKEATPANPKKS